MLVYTPLTTMSYNTSKKQERLINHQLYRILSAQYSQLIKPKICLILDLLIAILPEMILNIFLALGKI